MNTQQKNTADYFAKSEWEHVWRSEDFYRHERDLQNILGEYKSLREEIGSALETRLRWLEKKGAVRIIESVPEVGTTGQISGNKGHMDAIVMNQETYNEYSAMFSKFVEWLSFREKRGIYIWSEEVARKGLVDLRNTAELLAKQMTI